MNINLPYALLSRFDLMFLLLDKPNETADELMAKHICHVHQHMRAPKRAMKAYDRNVIRSYIAWAKKYQPMIPKSV